PTTPGRGCRGRATTRCVAGQSTYPGRYAWPQPQRHPHLPLASSVGAAAPAAATTIHGGWYKESIQGRWTF
ncbi:MAG: hypothetical protein JW855_05785, partial [Gammaproteobacteria bacterium]|nr:hypothetical protein [Gammaproteobacteria bacterium]